MNGCQNTRLFLPHEISYRKSMILPDSLYTLLSLPKECFFFYFFFIKTNPCIRVEIPHNTLYLAAMCSEDIVSDTAWHKIQTLQSNKNENFNSSFLSEQKKRTINRQDLKKNAYIPNSATYRKESPDTFFYLPLMVLYIVMFTIHIVGIYRLWKMKIFGFSAKSKEFDSKILNFY